MDELDCSSFFDHIDDLLVDFAGDDVDTAGGLACPKLEADTFPSIWSTHSDSLPNTDSVFSGHSASADLSAELSVPYEDIVQLEWLSNFVEDSFSSGESLTMNRDQQHSSSFHTSSPISVLESSSSCSGSGDKSSGGTAPGTAGAKLGRARSKRPRPAAFNPRPAIELITSSDHSDSFAESHPEETMMVKKKKKKIKVCFPAREINNDNNNGGGGVSGVVRKCMHCEITKTPQWRAGPLGPKTLCNACGVRFKSGRLHPEYRPAASPTFLPTVHSNSHKKVLEMRGRGGPADLMVPNVNAGSAVADF